MERAFKNSSDAPTKLQQARDDYKKRKYSEAVRNYDFYIQSSTDPVYIPQALFESADALARLQNWKDALSRFQQLAIRFPNSDEASKALMTSGSIQVGLARWNDAESTYRKLAEGPYDKPETLESQFRLINIAFTRGDLPKTAALFQKFVSAYPRDCRNARICSVLLNDHQIKPNGDKSFTDWARVEKECSDLPKSLPCSRYDEGETNIN